MGSETNLKFGFSKKQLAVDASKKVNFMSLKYRLQAVSPFLENPWRRTQNK